MGPLHMVKKKPVKVKSAGSSISADGIRKLSKKELRELKRNKIGLQFKIKKGDKFQFKVGNKVVLIVDKNGIRTA